MINSTTLNSITTCPICLEDFSDKKKMIITSCNHNFHERCATVWLDNKPEIKNKTCPVCRENPLPLIRAPNETNEVEKNPYIESKFEFAIRKNDVESIKEWLESDPTLVSKLVYNARSDGKFTPLGMACCYSGSIETIKTLIEAGANVNQVDPDSCTPLMLAVRAGNENAVDELLKHDIDMNVRDAFGFSCVFTISNYPSNLSTVKKLIAHGANIHVASKRGVTPLVTAASHGDLQLVRFFHAEGIDVDKMGKSKSTALMRAVQNDHTEVVKFLLEAGANPNLRDIIKQPALLFAVQNHNIEITKALLEYGANTNYKTKKGLTPLYIAARDGLIPFVKILLAHNADKSIGYKSNFFVPTRTAKDVAKTNGHTQIVEMLSSAS